MSSEGFWVRMWVRSYRGFKAEDWVFLRFADGYKKGRGGGVKDFVDDWVNRVASHCEAGRWGYTYDKPTKEWVVKQLASAVKQVMFWEERSAEL